MPIVHFEHNRTRVPADAVNLRGTHDGAGWTRENYTTGEKTEFQGPRGMWLWDSHVGLCLAERERNMHDDSDFFMLVWDAEKGEAEEIMFASTRGWSYPSLASKIDATPEVREAHRAWVTRCERHSKAQRIVDGRKADALMAAELGLPNRRTATRLRNSLNGAPLRWDEKGRLVYRYSRTWDHPRQATFVAVCKLLKAEKFKSDFKASLAAQVRKWCMDPAPAHSTPLSAKQLGYV